jgi:hypothetical protein
MRPTTSTPPPAGKATTKVTGLSMRPAWAHAQKARPETIAIARRH